MAYSKKTTNKSKSKKGMTGNEKKKSPYKPKTKNSRPPKR